MTIHVYQVGPDEKGVRLDQFLAHADSRFSRREWRQVITLGGVFNNNRRMSRVSRTVYEGETYTVHLDGRILKPLFHVTDAVILYEDDDLLAVDKPIGVEAQPTKARYRGTVYAAVRDYLKSHGQYATIGMHSRLDRDVSGVMVLSVHRRAHKAMTQVFSDRSVEKTYLGIVKAAPLEPEGWVKTGLKRDRRSGTTLVSAEGKESITAYRVLRSNADLSLLALYPMTGRTHQIRAHLRHIGAPILGDSLYGESSTLIERPALHAFSYTFPHPVTGEKVIIVSPLPQDMKTVLIGGGLELPLEIPSAPAAPPVTP